VTALAGAHVLVTGASSGIGREVCTLMAGRGARLLVTGRDPSRLSGTAASCGAEAVPADLADAAQVARLAERVAEASLDVVVHAAGYGAVRDAATAEDGLLRGLLAVNVEASERLTRAVLPGMLARGAGHLLFVTSIAAHLGVAHESAYAASKAAQAGYAESLRAELAGTGVVVSTVAPGVVDTAFFSRRGEPYARRAPRLMPAGRVAAAVVRSVETDRAECIVPAWLRVPVVLRALAPGAFARLAGRFG
jgi:short-subunit dehydrogenase